MSTAARFQEETAADLQSGYTAYMAAHVWGDEYEPYVEPLHCGSCNAVVSELLPCTWDTSLTVGACCLVYEDDEAECDCRFTGDMADPSECELHGSNRRRPITAVANIPEWKVA